MNIRRLMDAALFRQLMRFGTVGVTLMGLSVATYLVPAVWLGVHPLIANFFSYCVAATSGYVLHSRISFANYGGRDRAKTRAGRFITVSLVSLSLNSFFVWVITGPMEGPPWWPVAPMTLCTPLVTFALNRQWVFK